MAHRKNAEKIPAIAVIADVHFHDIESNYHCSGITLDDHPLTLRSWTDTRSSSRVFNESKAALLTALKRIEDLQIKHVVLLGDYSDDGQIEAIDRLVNLLRQHRDRFGTHFYAITGNHDAFGPYGKHQSTRFATASNETTLVTSDPKVATTEHESSVLTHRMYCEGVAQSILKMAEFGLFRQNDYLHWETPFGQDDSVHARQYEARSSDGHNVYRLIDASYLVEPVAGLWLLMIDANVFEPRNGQWKPTQKRAFFDSSDAGWNSLLHNRPHLMDWIKDVCVRADQSRKKLITCSHYPIIDPFPDCGESTSKLFGNSEMLRRRPEKAVATELIHYGMQLHFSGHLHVSALSRTTHGASGITDCQVPSLVAFPPCFKVLHSEEAHQRIDTCHLFDMPLDPQLIAFYQHSLDTNNQMHDGVYEHDQIDTQVLATSNYGDFLYERMHARTVYRQLIKEWPQAVAHAVLNTTAFDLVLMMLSGGSRLTPQQELEVDFTSVAEQFSAKAAEYGLSTDDLISCKMTRLVADWYCLRHAGPLANAFIGTDRLSLYSYLADTFGDLSPQDVSGHQKFFSVFLGLLKLSLDESTSLTGTESV